MGCHPISTFRESLEGSGKMEGGKMKLFSNLHCYHHSWVKVGHFALAFAFSMFCSCLFLHLVLYCYLLLACMLGGFGRVSFCVDLGYLITCIEGFSWGVLGITHPWIGKKWPCGGGL